MGENGKDEKKWIKREKMKNMNKLKNEKNKKK